MNIELILLYGLIISSISILGVGIVKLNTRVANFVNSHLNVLTAISAGVFLVTSFLLGRETLEILDVTQASIAFGIGILSYIVLHKILSPHRHEGVDHEHKEHSKKSAWKLLIGDAIHNIADGIFLVASFGISPLVGTASAWSIVLHEAPQEISEFLVLRKSGYSNTEASYRNFGTALSIFIGIAIGVFVTQSPVLQAYLLGATATFFLGIVFTDLFPLKKTISNTSNRGRMFAALILGIGIMAGISSALGHSHEHGDHDHEHASHQHDHVHTESFHEDHDYEINNHEHADYSHQHEH